MYNWMDVAQRTERIYDRVSQNPTPAFAERLPRYSTVGGVLVGCLCCFTVAVMHLCWRGIEWLWPREEVEVCQDFGTENHHRYAAALQSEYDLGVIDQYKEIKLRRGKVGNGKKEG